MTADLKNIRERAGFTQIEARKKLGVAHSSMYRYENEDRIPEDNVLWKMIGLYHMSTEELGEVIFNKLKSKNFDAVDTLNLLNEVKEELNNG
ncbi:helix-turn-helix transcriptional regulator [Clostridium baratii]|uniref:helix-turn-helix domain-containing protein n=1 Tax=Clostridium baratii TaxID=1561 RepID=UPI0030D0ED40